jgi:hypothetical protein
MMKRKYEPELKTILREIDPERAKRRQEEAMESLQRPTPPMFFEPVERGGAEDGAPEDEAARVSAASPWAKDGAGAGIDAAALPSAMRPAAVAAEERPVTKTARPAARRRWPASWILVLGGVGFLLAVALLAVVVMLGKAKESADRATARTSVAAAPSATVVPSVMVVPSAMGVPSPVATVTPGPPVTAMPALSATANPTASAAASAPPRKPHIKPRETHGDPHGDPVPTAAPVEPPPPPKYFE